MKCHLMISLAALVISVPAASTSKPPQSLSAPPFFLQCHLSSASINKNQTVEPKDHDYTFEVSLRDGQVRDLILSGFPFTISKASSGRIDAVNKSVIYAQSLAEGAELASLTINRVTGATSLSFFKAPTSDEVRSCKTLSRTKGDTGWYCESSYAVASHVGTCKPVKPKF